MLQRVFHSVDFFTKDMPQLNLRGETKVPTVFGGLLTIVFFTIIFLYSTMKLQMMVSRANPNISTFTEEL